MQAQEIRSIIEKAADAWKQADADAFADLFACDGEFILPGSRIVGHCAIRKAVVEFSATASEVSIQILQILTENIPSQDSVLTHTMIEWHWENTETATGHRYIADDAIAIDFRDGLISRWREYIDAR